MPCTFERNSFTPSGYSIGTADLPAVQPNLMLVELRSRRSSLMDSLFIRTRLSGQISTRCTKFGEVNCLSNKVGRMAASTSLPSGTWDPCVRSI